MKHIVVLPGDGIGPEVTSEAVNVLKTVCSLSGRKVEFSYHCFGGEAIDACGDPLPEETLQACRHADAILLGAIGGPAYDAMKDVRRPETGLLALRKELGLYANLRPVQWYPYLKESSPLKERVAKGTDLLIVRELTGGIYFGKKERQGEVATDECVYTEAEIDRVARKAFELALLRKRKLTLVDKANVLETSRLWRERVGRMAANFPEVKTEFLYVDHAAMKLITSPSSFDVILTENMFGDILSDEASVIPGSIGLLPSASLGNGPGLYEPIHGSWPEAAGTGKANPVGAILSAALLLEHSFGWREEADRIRDAVACVLRLGIGTADLGVSAPFTTRETGHHIATALLDPVLHEV